MKKNNRKTAAKKAANTVRVRREFVEQFGDRTLVALSAIAKNTVIHGDAWRRSLAAYKANLTRGTYSAFVSTDSAGSITRDRLGLARMA